MAVGGKTFFSGRRAYPGRIAPAIALWALLGADMAASEAPGRTAFLAPAHTKAVWTNESLNGAIQQYCQGCHNDLLEWAGLTLESFRVEEAAEDPVLAEKVIRKLRTRLMPPSTVKRPDEATYEALAGSLEERIDSAASQPDPGYRTFQRLNRAEYERSVRDLIDLQVDASAFLPPDTISHGFDNIADVQTPSATLMEGYLRAAGRISREAIGEPGAKPRETTFKVPRTAAQLRHVEGAPFGTRGGISVLHNFPADGEYVFKIVLHGTPTGQLFGSTAEAEQVEIALDGTRVALLDIDPHMSESDPDGLNLETAPIAVKTGPHRVAAAFIEKALGPVDDVIAPIDHTLADTQIGSAWGITTLPHLRRLSVRGPYNVTGVSETPSRRKIFSCRPISAAEELPCAKEIIQRLARQAYRRPLDRRDLDGLISFYETAAEEGDFESGIRGALQAILASPHFVFRIEQVRAEVEPGGSHRLSDHELATRLAYFLWSTAPDRDLLALADQRRLSQPQVLRETVLAMLADPRSEALGTRFAAQWLRLQDLDRMHPDALIFPYYDHTLAEALRRETELFFENLIREDRSVLELLTADYTFVNERLARHYGIANVTGKHFRRVRLPDEKRRGLLGQGSVLTLTSIPDRTSPVMRGKWVMEVLLGISPPPPPANVPDLEETKAVEGRRLLSVRERMQEHRANPNCNSCHRVIDPLGLALENFDVTGAWRIKDNGVPVDATGEMYEGSVLDGPAGLRQALLKRSDAILTSFTESLMTYGLGRRVEARDMPAVRAIVRRAAANENRASSFILGVVESAAFQKRKSGAQASSLSGEH